MVWFVQPLEKKGVDGKGCGIWHLTASSDEGGGFYVGCGHDHASAEEAQTCLEARKAVGSVTGFPLEMDTIKINGVEHQWPHADQLSHERICEVAGEPVEASVTYYVKGDGDSSRRGLTYAGKSIKTDDCMVINCVVTGKA